MLQHNPAGPVKRKAAQVVDVFEPLAPGDLQFDGGLLGERYDANAVRRLLVVDENDLLDTFEHRSTPHQDWQGEHVGKFLHAAVLTWATNGDARLKTKTDRVVKRLLATQEADGYLGGYPPAIRWTRWDVWVHKYVLLGLLTYYQFTHDQASLTACRKIGDLLASTFGQGGRDLNKAGEHVGMAATSVLEPMLLLYRATDDAKYLAFGQFIVKHYDAPGGPAILTSLERTKSVARVANGKAYEMLSNFNGIIELYRATGEKRLLGDMKTAWQDLVKRQIYVTGSGSSHELWTKDASHPGGKDANPCETCVTVTWEQFNLQMLRLTGAAEYADELERTVYNHLLAAQKPTGEAWAYYTPLFGVKPYSPTTTCCLSSGPRGIALLPSIAVMKSHDGGLVVNLFSPLSVKTRLAGGEVSLRMQTEYPLDGRAIIEVDPSNAGQKFPLHIRIPRSAIISAVSVNDAPVGGKARPGEYVLVNRVWSPCDRIEVRWSIQPIVTTDAGAKVLSYGPMVMALDSASNPNIKDFSSLTFDPSSQARWSVQCPHGDGRIELRTAMRDADGCDVPVVFVPYAFAGESGSHFEIWLPDRR